jgi:hypothetical protein
MHPIQKLLRLAIPVAWSSVSLTAAPGQPLLQAEQEFTIHGRSYPPGTYRVKESSPAGLVTLRHESSGQTILLLTQGTGSPNNCGGARLVFRWRKGQPELVEVWTGNGSGRVVR